MADFVAVLKKTIDAQQNPDQELRQRVYAKARSTIEQKLVAANPPVPVAQRQRQLLEDAIETVEADYRALERAAEEAAQPETQGDPLEDFLKAVQQAGSTEPVDALPSEHADDDGNLDDPQWRKDREEESAFANNNPYEEDGSQKRGRSKGLILALVGVLLLGVIGYAGWSQKDKLQEYLAGFSDQFKSSGSDTAPATSPATGPDANSGGSVVAPETNATAPIDATPKGEQKLTQRLMPDGNEVDAGPAGEEQKIGEGTSTSAVTGNSTTPPVSGAAGGQATSATTAPATIPVGQRAFFYEERNGQEAASSAKGNVVWAVIQDSPGDGLPDEPAIRADVAFPDTKVSLRMTIRRNGDKSIPASHLIEMIYTVPDDFPGGVIESVQRVTFKDSEQAAGNPLAAIPMKIADNFFIVALNDARTAEDMNLSLMRRQQWVDIPVIYRNGRRALLSMEKGVPGEKVFDEVLKSWESLGAAAN